MLLLDILINTVLVLAILFLWAIFVLFLIAAIKDLKKMPKPPKQILVDPRWVSLEEYAEILKVAKGEKSINDVRKDAGYSPLTEEEVIRFNTEMYKQEIRKTFDAQVYDQENNPWNVRHISSGKQNGKDQRDV